MQKEPASHSRFYPHFLEKSTGWTVICVRNIHHCGQHCITAWCSGAAYRQVGSITNRSPSENATTKLRNVPPLHFNPCCTSTRARIREIHWPMPCFPPTMCNFHLKAASTNCKVQFFSFSYFELSALLYHSNPCRIARTFLRENLPTYLPSYRKERGTVFLW